MGKTPPQRVFFFTLSSYSKARFALQPYAMLVLLFTPPPAALEKMLYPVLPACLLMLALLILGVIISVGFKNKMRAHR
jgi:hypothetical protein